MRQARPARHGRRGNVKRLVPLAIVLLLALSHVPARAQSESSLAARLSLWGYVRGATFAEPRGVAIDPLDGAIYVSNTGEHRIEIFSKTGRPLGRFVHRVSRAGGPLEDGRPTALAFDAAGHLLVVDAMAVYVDVLDRRLRPITRLAIPAGHPAALAVAGDGTIYVGTGAEASAIHRFGRDYAPLGAWGEEGTAPGRLDQVSALAVLGDSALAVACERTDLAVQIFTPAGVYRRGFGTHEMGEGNLSMPSGMIATADGRLWVLDEIRRTLQTFDAGGTVVSVITGSGTARGGFDHPSAIAWDGRGSLAVADRGIGRVQVFDVHAE